MVSENRILQLVYTFFLGLLLALFVGVGVNTFYPGPEPPEYPTELNTLGKEPSEQELAKQQEFDKASRQHEEDMKPYNRNVSIITLTAAVLLLAVSMLLEKRSISVIPDGVMLGGLFTLLYSVGRGFAAQDSKYTFVVVTVGLIVVLYLGYHRFGFSHTAKVSPKK